MRTHRFGRKIKLPATIVIKHQIRLLMAQDNVEEKNAQPVEQAARPAIHGKPVHPPKALSVTPTIAGKERAERLLQWKQDRVKAASEYEAKEQATRLLTLRLRAERLAREQPVASRASRSRLSQ
jgi:hypothetical protein